MKASEAKLQRVIEGTNQYVVPLFQRKYSWDSKEWNTLWEDLLELYEEESRRNHFIGSIVTMPTQSVPEGVAKYLLIGTNRSKTVRTFLILTSSLWRWHRRTPSSTGTVCGDRGKSEALTFVRPNKRQREEWYPMHPSP